jgi:hypothetical protein
MLPVHCCNSRLAPSKSSCGVFTVRIDENCGRRSSRGSKPLQQGVLSTSHVRLCPLRLLREPMAFFRRFQRRAGMSQNSPRSAQKFVRVFGALALLAVLSAGATFAVVLVAVRMLEQTRDANVTEVNDESRALIAERMNVPETALPSRLWLLTAEEVPHRFSVLMAPSERERLPLFDSLPALRVLTERSLDGSIRRWMTSQCGDATLEPRIWEHKGASSEVDLAGMAFQCGDTEWLYFEMPLEQ